MARMTKTSKENLLVADRIKIEKVKSDYYTSFLVAIYKDGNIAFLSDAEGPISYLSLAAARRVVKRIRPDLEPTTI